jgi:glycosyltransferase involved in cell wall biosynthesis
MKLTLIITTFNWPEALSIVLKSVAQQTIFPDEIIIADDGSDERTRNLIISLNKNLNLNIIHSWQEDKGFRASMSRNKAIQKSSGDYIVLIDGDSILHPNFIRDHIEIAELRFFVQGSRVLISEEQTKTTLVQNKVDFSFFSLGLQNRKNAVHSKILSFIFSNKKNYLHGIKTCNMAFFRKDCLNINGFNNDFEGWGREDSEFAIRLINSGISRKNVRFSAIQFHLWHNENSRSLLQRNNKMLDDAIKNCTHWCRNGISIMEKDES